MGKDQSTTEEILDVFLETTRKELATKDIIKILKVRKDEAGKHRVYVAMAYLVKKGQVVKTRKVGVNQYYTLKPKQETMPLEEPTTKPSFPVVVNPTPVKKRDKPKVEPRVSYETPLVVWTFEVMTENAKRINEIFGEIKDLLEPSEDIRTIGKRFPKKEEVVEIKIVKFKK